MGENYYELLKILLPGLVIAILFFWAPLIYWLTS